MWVLVGNDFFRALGGGFFKGGMGWGDVGFGAGFGFFQVFFGWGWGVFVWGILVGETGSI